MCKSCGEANRSDESKRMQAGIAVLNAQRPGWIDEIDLDRLSIMSLDDCVLGQLWGSYRAGLNALDISGFAHGFSGVATQTWREEIERLRHERTTVAV